MKIIDTVIKFLYGSLFFLTPLIFTSNTSELFEFNKMIFIYLITVLIVFFWLTKMILTKKIVFRKTLLDIPILFFLASQILSTIFSIDSHTSLFGYYGRFNGGLVSIISYVILYYGFVSNFVNFEYVLKTSLFSSFLVMAYGLPGKLGHDITCFLVTGGSRFDNSCWDNASLQFQPEIRTFSTLGQPNWLGAYLAFNFFIGTYFFLKNLKNKKALILNSIYLFSNFSFILFTRSRSALAATVIGLILFTFYYFFFIKKDFKKIVIGLLLITLIPILLFKTGIEKIDRILVSPTSFFKVSSNLNFQNISSNNSLENASGVTESLDIRKIVWKGAVNLGLKYPLFGTGVETFAYAYNFVRPIEHNFTSEWDYVYNKAHNEFLNYFATTGFTGLITYSLLIGTVIYLLLLNIKNQASEKDRKNKKEKQYNQITVYPFLLISYLTILITNFFGFSTTTINIFFYLIPAFVLSSQEPKENRIINLSKPNLFQYLSVFMSFSVMVYFLFSIFSYWLADTYYVQGVNYSKSQISDYQKAASFFEKALSLRYEPVYEDRFSSNLAYLAAVASYQKQNDMATQLIQLSEAYNKKTLQKYPKNIFYWKTRAKNQYLFYEVTSDINYLIKGLDALKEGRKIAPTDPKIPYSLAVYYSLVYDSEKNFSQKELWRNKSLEEVSIALKLKNDFQDGINLEKDLRNKYALN